ncbi:MAG TPA: hypothetical protein VNE41_09370 [Chitinophagaceae bacterium]|nr:hypothetical protein [Chitinophagaceae bacterium]
MKGVFLSVCTFFITGCIFGQAQKGSVKYQNSELPAAVIVLPYSPDFVSEGMIDYFNKKGKTKENDLKGFITFRNVKLLESDSNNADLYFKIEQESRRERGTSIISLLLSKPKNGDMTGIGTQSLTMDQAKTWLNNLARAMQAYSLELKIRNQNDVVIKAETKLNNLTDYEVNMERKRLDLEKKIQENKQEQQVQMTEIENQKQKLSALISQRK